MTARLFILCVLAAATGCKTTATYTIKTTGAIAETTLKVGGAVTKTALNTTFDLAGAAFRKGTVTVIDNTTGVSKKIPWEKGLNVSEIETAGRVFEIVRGTKKLMSTPETILKPGDIVRIQ
jgi:hypothetical protein